MSIAVDPPAPSVANGTTQQLTATGTFTDATTQVITHLVVWSSSDLAVATISNTVGSEVLATATGVGSATLTAASGAISGSTTLTVTAATLVSIDVTPVSPSIPSGLTQQFTATGTYTDATTQDLTATATWSSSDLAVASISNAPSSEGLASSAGFGVTTITATAGAISGSTTLTVTVAMLTSIAVTPADPSIPNGLTQQFTATGTYTDATTQDLTNAVTWSSSALGVASIWNAPGSRGLATSTGTGVTTITATSGGIFGSTSLTVTAATLVSIEVTPADPSIASGFLQQFSATGTYTDATTQDLTTAVTWSSSALGVATISNAPGSQGLASSAGTGVTTITATSGAISGSTSLTVTPAVLLSIAVTPVNASVPLGLTQQYTATGTYSDGSTQNLTTSVIWASSNTGAATISNIGGSQGLASTVATGTTVISATLGALSDSTSLAVTPVALMSIALTPADSTQPRNTSFQMTATGTYSNGTTADVTTSATWVSSFPSKISVNDTTNKGLVSVGNQPNQTVTITATVGSIVGSTTVTSSKLTSPGCARATLIAVVRAHRPGLAGRANRAAPPPASPPPR